MDGKDQEKGFCLVGGNRMDENKEIYKKIAKIKKKYENRLFVTETNIDDYEHSGNQELICAVKTLRDVAEEIRIIIDALGKQILCEPTIEKLNSEVSYLKSELRKWNRPFDDERLEGARQQYMENQKSLCAANIYIRGLEHALQHMIREGKNDDGTTT